MIEWIAVAGLPFDTLQSPQLRAALRSVHEEVELIGRSQVTRKIKQLHLQLEGKAREALKVRLLTFSKNLLKENSGC